jgi:hypothetical protein
LLDKYKRLDGETLEDYEYRLCSTNEATGELETWQDVADIFNEVWDTNYTDSKVRKDYQNFKRLLPSYLKTHQDQSAIIDGLESEKLVIRKERQRLFDQRREFNTLARKASRVDNLEDRLTDAAKELNLHYPLSLNTKKIIDNCDDDEGLLVLSDWHYGMTTDNIWNKYNVEICKQRINTLYSEVVHKIQRHCPARINILLLGDLFDGALRASSRVADEELTCDQLMHVAEIVANFIDGLSAYVPNIVVYSNYGNHCRTTQKKEDSIHADNMEKIIPWWLNARLQLNSNVSFVDSKYHEFTLIQILGNNIVAVHGDLEKNFQGIPVDMQMIFSKKLGISVDYTISADKHHLESCDKFGVQAFLAPSLCGTDNYANGIRRYSHPMQLLMFFTKNGLDAMYNIRVDL